MKFFKYIAVLFFAFSTISFANDIKLYNQAVFFGDSLTDNGNLYHSFLGFMPKSPPYYQGRFTNGPTWAEQLVHRMQATNSKLAFEDDAYGGETTVFHNPFDGFLPYALSESIDSYVLRYTFDDKSETIYFFWIGANDYLSGSNDVDGATGEVVQRIHDMVEKLIQKGGKYFVVMNLPDMSRIPYGRASGMAENIYSLTVMHNAKLATSMFALQGQYPGVTIRQFDIYSLFNQLLDHADEINARYHTHISNVTGSCWSGGYHLTEKKLQQQLTSAAKNKNVDVKQLTQYVMQTPALAEAYRVSQGYADNLVPCADPDDYLFWDKVHPTAAVHGVLAAAIAEFLGA